MNSKLLDYLLSVNSIKYSDSNNKIPILVEFNDSIINMLYDAIKRLHLVYSEAMTPEYVFVFINTDVNLFYKFMESGDMSIIVGIYKTLSLLLNKVNLVDKTLFKYKDNLALNHVVVKSLLERIDDLLHELFDQEYEDRFNNWFTRKEINEKQKDALS
jgi:hypothetical protein